MAKGGIQIENAAAVRWQNIPPPACVSRAGMSLLLLSGASFSLQESARNTGLPTPYRSECVRKHVGHCPPTFVPLGRERHIVQK